MPLPLPARAVIGGVAASSALLVVGTADRYADAGTGRAASLVLLAGLLVAAWTWPLIVYRGRASEAVHADEGLVLVALLLLPPQGVLVAVGVAAAVGQVVHRRGVVKAAFNWAATTAAAAVAVLLAHGLGLETTGAASGADLAAAVAGAVAFSSVSTALIALVLATTSATTLRAAVLDGAELRLLVLAMGCVVAAPAGLAARTSTWAVALLPPLYLGVRWVLAGRFEARHDRDRLLGLFDATLAVHRPLAADEVRDELTGAAAELLRCPQVRLSPDTPAADELGARLVVDGRAEWLALAGRRQAEPYDAADRRLLDALAAVGRSALSHAEMYARAHRQGEELTAIMGALAEGVVAVDATGRPVYVNPAGAALLATSPEALTAVEVEGVGASMADTARRSLVALVARCLHARTAVGDEATVLLRFDGTTFPASWTCAPIFAGEEPAGAVLVFRDVSDRIAAEKELAHHAFHDQLTGLPNRRLFLDRLDQALLRGERSGTAQGVLLVDVDRFKAINDNLGQQAGDELLQEIARRIAIVARPSDTLARFGGDVFTVLVEDVEGVVAAERLAARIVSVLAAPVQLSEGRQVVATASIGIATTDGHMTADDVLHDADVAMSQAKSAGGGGYHCYDAEAMHTRSVQRFDLESDLRSAIAAHELTVHYQPKVDLQRGTVRDVEALVRWPGGDHGMRMPGEFIGIAEESGLILPLGRFVLVQAVQQARRWEGSGVDVSVAVNLSARQFQNAGLLRQVEAVLRWCQLPPERLCLEITESLAMQDLELTVRTLGRLKGLGVELAIDDFGTGHSSLSYLKRFPVDEVKIDRSFVRDLVASPVDAAIVSAIVGLADALGMRTVVEGVEDPAQLERVRELGCSLAQGFYVATALPADQVTPFLTRAPVPSPRSGEPRTIDLRGARHLA